MPRQPVDRTVVGEHLVFVLSRFDEPASARILDQRIVIGSPTEWILVLVLFLMIKLALFFEPASDGFVSVLDPNAFVVRCLGGKFSVGANGADHLRTFTGFETVLFSDQ